MFRALEFNNHLYLSWNIELPPSTNYQADWVYVGFTQVMGATDQNFVVTVNPNTATAQVAQAGTTTAYSMDPAGNFGSSVATPTWVATSARVWYNSATNFAVQMIVPITTSANINDGLNLGNDFNMWFEMEESLPPAIPNSVWDARWPDGRQAGLQTAADVTGVSVFPLQGPQPGSWAPFHRLSTGPGTCSLGGVSITWNNIGTNNPPTATDPNPPASEIRFPPAGGPNPADTNTFFASPTNNMGLPIPPRGITATFRIADWGSVADPQAPWTPVPVDSPGTQPVFSTATILNGATAAKSNISFPWTVANISGGEQWLTEFQGGCPPNTPTCQNKPPHQCMLVELAGGLPAAWQANHVYALNDAIVDPASHVQLVTMNGTSGASQPVWNDSGGATGPDGSVTWADQGAFNGLTFLNNGVFRNMDFVPASEFSREATISIKGLKPIGGADRDVYLYVQTTNMPSIVDALWKDLYNKLFGPPGKRNDQRTREVIARMSEVQLAEALPAYRVHGFHDTGKKITIAGTDYLILHPQSSFGYYVLPHADVLGWVNNLEGAKRVGANFYRISIPNHGVAKITTKISALEKLKKGCFDSKLATAAATLLIGLLSVGLLVYRPRRSKG